MPTIRIDKTRIKPSYPQDNKKRNEYYQWTINNSICHPNLLSVNGNDIVFWDNLPGPNSNARLRIAGRDFQSSFNCLTGVTLSDWLGLSGNENDIPIIILCAINIYPIVKISYPETAHRTTDGKLIFYKTDYITVNEKDSFTDIWDGRCILNIDPSTLSALAYEIDNNNWENFWIRIAILYESVFTYRNEKIENPDHAKITIPETELSKEYLNRKEDEAIPKEYVIKLLENSLLTGEVCDKILEVMQKDPNLNEKIEALTNG